MVLFPKSTSILLLLIKSTPRTIGAFGTSAIKKSCLKGAAKPKSKSNVAFPKTAISEPVTSYNLSEQWI